MTELLFIGFGFFAGFVFAENCVMPKRTEGGPIESRSFFIGIRKGQRAGFVNGMLATAMFIALAILFTGCVTTDPVYPPAPDPVMPPYITEEVRHHVNVGPVELILMPDGYVRWEDCEAIQPPPFINEPSPTPVTSTTGRETE